MVDDFLDCFLDVVLVVAYADNVRLYLSEYSEKVYFLTAEYCLVYRFEGFYHVSALLFWNDGFSALPPLDG